MPPTAAWARIESINDEGRRGATEGSANKLIGPDERAFEVPLSLKWFLGFCANKTLSQRNLLAIGRPSSPRQKASAAARHVNCSIQAFGRVYARAHRRSDFVAKRGKPRLGFGTSIATRTGN